MVRLIIDVILCLVAFGGLLLGFIALVEYLIDIAIGGSDDD